MISSSYLRKLYSSFLAVCHNHNQHRCNTSINNSQLVLYKLQTNGHGYVCVQCGDSFKLYTNTTILQNGKQIYTLAMLISSNKVTFIRMSNPLSTLKDCSNFLLGWVRLGYASSVLWGVLEIRRTATDGFNCDIKNIAYRLILKLHWRLHARECFL